MPTRLNLATLRHYSKKKIFDAIYLRHSSIAAGDAIATLRHPSLVRTRYNDFRYNEFHVKPIF